MTQEIREKIYEHSYQLALQVRSSEEYLEFTRAKEALEADDVSMHVFLRLRAEQMNLFVLNMVGDNDPTAQNEHMNETFQMISEFPLIGDYLNAEYNMQKVFKKIQQIFADELQFSFNEQPEAEEKILN